LARTSRTLRVKIGITILLGGSVYLLASCASIMGVDEPTLDPAAVVLPSGADASPSGAEGGSEADGSANVDAATRCTGATCADGRACCNGACADTKSDIANCGGCGKTCGKDHGAPKCTDGSCAWTCDVGYARCDTTGSAGCETKVDTTSRCGACNIDCSATVANANSPSCASLKCTYTSCTDDFVDKDNNRQNGCEAACGADGQPCCSGGGNNSCKGRLQCNNGTCGD